MSTNAVAPAFASQKPSPVFQQAFGAAPQESLADGIGASYGIIGYKGKVLSLRYRGETKIFVRPDDGTPAGYIDVIILRSAKNKSKSYYPEYQEGASDRPICASLDGIVPDEDVQQKQSNACAVCPRNVWKTTPDGRKKRECADFKRLAVLLMPAQTKAMFGTPLMEPVFLRVPAASLNDLANFGERMSNMGWHYSSYITRISFDPTAAYPKFVFEALKGLTDAEAPVVLPLRDDPNSLRITGEDKVAAISGAAQPLQIPQQSAVPNNPVPPPPVQTTGVAAQVDNGLLDLAAAPPAQAASAAQSLPQTATVAADVGKTVESDKALDDRITALLAG